MMTLRLEPNGHAIRLQAGDQVPVVDVAGAPMVVGAEFQCAVCDQWPKYEIGDGTVRVAEPCSFPDGITTVIDLAVPSGKMVVTDDLRPVYGADKDALADYNTALGQAQYIYAMAAQGCAYGPVRNSSPNLYRLAAPGRYVIASPGYSESEEDWGDDELDLTPSYCHGAEKVASICTDLWAYSIADYEHWRASGGRMRKPQWCYTVLDVAPGTYRFTHHTGEHGFDWDADERIFADIELVEGRA